MNTRRRQHCAEAVDFCVEDHGTVFVITPISRPAQEWVDENVQMADWQRVGKHAFAADHRPGRVLLEAICEYGFHVRLSRAGR